MKRITFAVLAVLVILAALSVTLPNGNTKAETKSAVHIAAHMPSEITLHSVLSRSTLSKLPTFNTGECGYYKEQGMIHRNEFITPSFCFHDTGAPTVTTVSKVKKHHGSNVQIIDNGGLNPSDKTDTGNSDKKPAKSCHNKNSGKDGTVSECNAGGGQEKHSK